MDLLITVAGAVGFFAFIIASVLAHELGHLIPAKLFGIKATEYFVGFGPKIWGKRIGETEYGMRWLPLGGYVKLVGMYPPRRPDARDSRLQRIADAARGAEAEDIILADDGRLFYQQTTGRKLVVMAGGILTNLAIAFALFWGVFGIQGMAVRTTTIERVDECIIPATRTPRTCEDSDPPTPAAQAGLRPGDIVVRFNGSAIDTWEQFSDLIRANMDAAASIVVERGGAETTLPTVHTIVTSLPNRVDPSTRVDAGFLGVVPTREIVHAGPLRTAAEMWEMSRQSLVALATLPIKVYDVVVNIATGQPRDPNSPMSIVGASRVAGEVAASDLGWGQKVAVGAGLLGGLNLFLFWLNVVPLPPMDGGHIAGALWEGLRRGIARLHGRPDPGPVDTAKLVPVAYGVGLLLLVLGAVLILADVINPVQIF